MTKRTEHILGLLWLLLCLGLALYYLIFCRSAYLDSDMSSELMLAKLLSEEGGILSKNWYYSTELRVLNTQLIFAPLFLIFDNWHTVRVVGTVILWGILLGSYAYMLHGLGLDRWFCLTAGFLLLPHSDDYFHYIVMGCYYIPHICISLVTLGILFQLERSHHRCFLFCAACILAFAAGLGGIRQPIILYVPLCLAAFILFLCRSNKSEKRILILSATLLVFSGLGYGGNRLLSKQFHFFSFGDIHPELHLEGILTSVRGLLGCFGFNADFFNLPRLLLALACLAGLIALWVLLWQKRAELHVEEMILSLYLPCSLLILSGVYTISNMDFSIRYFLPVFVFSLPLSVLALRHGCNKHGSLFYLAVLAIISFSSFPNPIAGLKDSEYKELATVLQEANYKQGLASFWNSNILTEYSNGEIETWTFKDSPTCIYEWLQETTHAEELPSGKCFLLLEDEEGPVPKQAPYYKLKDYSLYTFEDSLALKQYLCYWFESFNGDNHMVTHGTDIEGQRILHSGGLSYGPYISLLPGEYEVSIRGEDLANATFDVFCCETGTLFPYTVLEHSSTEIKYSFFLPEETNPLELRVFNTKNDPVALDEIELIYIRDTNTIWCENFSGENSYLIHGTDSDGLRLLFPGGISYGPYLPLSAGKYLIEIHGDELANASFDLCYNTASAFIPYELKCFDDSVISYSFTLYNNAENIEFRIFNNSTETITLDDITLTCQEPF